MGPKRPRKKEEKQSAPEPPPTRLRFSNQKKVPAVVTVPTAPTAKNLSNTISGIEPDSSQGSSNSASSEKSLSGGELVQQVLKMVKNRDRAELMILELMAEYSFNFSRLKELLRGTSIAIDLLVWLMSG